MYDDEDDEREDEERKYRRKGAMEGWKDERMEGSIAIK